MWLCLEDCILIGFNYQKRGGIGPSACTLCLKDEESVTHLFINCQCTQLIWVNALTTLRIDNDWKSPTIEENLKCWFFKFPNSRHIPFLIMWDIWKYRNKLLFENWNRNDPWIHKKDLQSIKKQPYKEEEDKLEVLLNPTYFNNNPIGFFDSASVENNCGIGLYLKLSSSHSIKALFVGGT